MIIFKLKALTDIWTGGIDKGKADKLYLTGIRGSLRWWYEVLIRGLGKYACDPNDKDFRCSLNIPIEDKRKIKNGEYKLEDYVKTEICPVCYLFGCTGWGGKLIIRIKDEHGRIKNDYLKAGTKFTLEIIEKKKLEEQEILLLQMTLKLIIDYGAIGGKTVLKPADKNTPEKNIKFHHLDFGLIERVKENNINLSNVPDPEDKIYSNNKPKIDEYLKKFNINRNNESEWPNLRNFWFVIGDYIDRTSLNKIVSRDINNPQNYTTNATPLQKWLGGEIRKSKKIFSFHGFVADSKNPNKVIQSFTPRCFGYAKQNELNDVIKLIECVSNSEFKKKIKKGDEVLSEL